jgi:hypothetical protein
VFPTGRLSDQPWFLEADSDGGDRVSTSVGKAFHLLEALLLLYLVLGCTANLKEFKVSNKVWSNRIK